MLNGPDSILSAVIKRMSSYLITPEENMADYKKITSPTISLDQRLIRHRHVEADGQPDELHRMYATEPVYDCKVARK